MNRCYRLVWNRLRQCLVVVAEITRGRGKSGSSQRSVKTCRRVWLLAWPLGLAPLLGMATGFGGTQAHALVAPATGPVGGQVTAGSGTIRQGGLTTTIEQQSQSLALNWRSFNIGADHTVNFAQPNAQSIAVNRIAGSDGSVILGHLNANGQVFLINPNGVLFGRSAQVQVGGLVASTLDMGDNQLAGGTRQFAGSGRGNVTNQGNLSANEGGYIALIGPQVTNQGTLSAPGGTVAMGAGNAVTLSFDTNRLLSLQVDRSTLNALADNRQLILADGGQVLMSAGAKDALLSSVVNNSGVIQAQTVDHRDGKIVLLGGMTAGTTQVAGTLDASAPAGGNGGFIETSAAHVQVADGAKITTLADTGKIGTWLIDPQDYNIAATGGDMTGAALSASLGSSDVAIQSASGGTAGSGNINLNDAVSWSANTKLTLTASNDVDINANLTATGASAGLVLAPNTTNGADAASGSGQYRLANGAVITLSGATPSLNIAGQSYTVINSLGTATSTTGKDLQGMNGNLAGNYALGSNIDASATSSWRSGQGITVIGTTATPFQGIFDGLGHTITGLTGAGFFGTTATGSAIRNVGLSDRNAFSITYGYISGLVTNNYGVINQAYVSGDVTSPTAYVGGLVESNFGTISDSHADGVVSGTVNVGGLVAVNSGTISQSYATNTVTGTSNVGGLVGLSGGKIIQSYATGAVSGTTNVGGLTGVAQGTSPSAAVTQSWASGKVTGTSAGGLAGYGNATITASYWDSYSTGQTKATGSGGGAVAYAVTSDPTQSAAANYAFKQSAYGNLSFAGGGWFMVDGSTRPFLQSEYSTSISNAHQLQLVAMNLAAAYTLANDIDASETARAVNSVAPTDAAGMWSGAGFSPLGTASTAFAGSFDGLGRTIAGLTIKRPTISNVGLFGYATKGSVIRHVGLLGGSMAGQNAVGSLIGYNTGGTVSQAYASSMVSGGQGIGGLVGVNSKYGSPGTGGAITQSYATGTVTGTFYVGGLVGHNTTGTINQTYATGKVSGATSVGGLVGENTQAAGVIGAITQSYATGAVSGNSSVGGLLGSNIGTVTTSYWNTQTTGQNTSAGGSGAVGLTGSQMMNAASFTGWDIAGTGGSSSLWRIYTGQTAPLLRTFMTGLSVTASAATVTYNANAFPGTTNYTTGSLAPSVWLPSGTVNPSLILGQVNTATPAINAGSYALNTGLYSSQMGYDIALTSGTLTIDKAPLTVTGAVAANKTYDGTTAATISGATLGGTVYGSDTPTLGNAGAGTFADKNAGTGKAVTTAATLGGTGASNYQLTQPTGLTADITPAALTVTGISAADKVYDGTSTATLDYGTATLSGKLSGDNLTAGGANGSFSDQNVGSGKSVSIVGIALGGTDAGNYTLTATTASATAAITPAPLTYAANPLATTYGTPATGLSGTVTGFVGGEGQSGATSGTLVFDTATTASSIVGGYAINGSGLSANHGNYTFVQAPGNATALTINPAALTVTANDASKTYDAAAYSGGNGVTYAGFVNGETAAALGGTLAYTGTAQGAINAGTYAITPGGLASTNYAIGYVNGTLSIGPTALAAVTASLAGTITKPYDGTTTATLSSGNYLLSGFASGEGATVTQTVGTYNSANVAAATTVTATLSPGDFSANTGTLLSNYTLPTSASGSASITPVGLTVTANAASKTYDAVAYSGSNGVTYGGFVHGETASVLGGTLGYAGTSQGARNAGNYVLTPGGLTSTNYTIGYGNGTLTIDPAALGISTSDVNKVYDGTTTALGKPIAAGGTLFGTDSLSGGTFTFDTRDVGANKTVNVSAVTVNDGNGGANYAVSYVSNTHSSITTRPLVLLPIANVSGIGADNKVYDGTTAATLDFGNAVFNGVAAGDALSVGSAVGLFSDKNVGIGKTVFISGITLGGTDASNYRLLDTTATTTADIIPLGITVTASGRDKVYDGTTRTNVALAGSGVLAGDNVQFSATGTFADKSVGTAKPVAVGAVSATGADAGNYRIIGSTGTSADITPATLTYLATSHSAAAGWVSTGLTGVVTGLVGGDAPGTATTGTLGWSTPATAASPAGQYAIVGTGLAATNYVFQQAAGNASALHLSADTASTAVTPQGMATLVAQLQQGSPPAQGNPQQDDDNPWAPSFAASRGATSGLPVPYVRIINGGVRMP